MFYSYVRNLPMVDQNFSALLRGALINTKSGNLRMVREDREGKDIRSFSIRDNHEDIMFHLEDKSMTVTHNLRTGRDVRSYTIKPHSPLRPFAIENFELGDRRDVRRMLHLLQTLSIEYRKQRNLLSRTKKVLRDPKTQISLICGSIYVIVTVFLMIHDFL